MEDGDGDLIYSTVNLNLIYQLTRQTNTQIQKQPWNIAT